MEQRGFPMIEMGMLAWIPYLAADLGALTGGWLSGCLVARGNPVLSARLSAMMPCAFIMPGSLAIHHAPSRAVTIALICVVAFAHMAWKTNQNTLTNDLFPHHLIGAASGLLAFGTSLGGTLFVWMTGHVVHGFDYGQSSPSWACCIPFRISSRANLSASHSLPYAHKIRPSDPGSSAA